MTRLGGGAFDHEARGNRRDRMHHRANDQKNEERPRLQHGARLRGCTNHCSTPEGRRDEDFLHDFRQNVEAQPKRIYP